MIGGPGLASSFKGTRNISAIATAIDAIIVAVSNMSFMFHPEYSKALNNALVFLPFHSTLPEPFSRSRRLRQPALGKREGKGRLQAMGASVLIGILITFLVIILVLYLVQRLPLDARARQIAQIIVIIIGIISLLKYLAVF